MGASRPCQLDDERMPKANEGMMMGSLGLFGHHNLQLGRAVEWYGTLQHSIGRNQRRYSMLLAVFTASEPFCSLDCFL